MLVNRVSLCVSFEKWIGWVVALFVIWRRTVIKADKYFSSHICARGKVHFPREFSNFVHKIVAWWSFWRFFEFKYLFHCVSSTIRTIVKLSIFPHQRTTSIHSVLVSFKTVRIICSSTPIYTENLWLVAWFPSIDNCKCSNLLSS